MKTIWTIILTLALTLQVHADCVWNAKSKRSFQRIDNHTILLTGGPGPDILIKTWSFVYSTSTVAVLKDSFCSHENAVLLIDGEVADAREVRKLD